MNSDSATSSAGGVSANSQRLIVGECEYGSARHSRRADTRLSIKREYAANPPPTPPALDHCTNNRDELVAQ
ncbi:hypothetical protein Y032_0634g908 [Ancylostoma ceylanicum]|uniref:Uncharacterized protein n=1 Tax=Ancylostoma ceylanicum TaxID=53326 RepID=A0A016WJI5_9BILA|nr:hypothetical protein Y032_0634g908 [Ancylostoma ceylanicum]